jgi:hypothetical protein
MRMPSRDLWSHPNSPALSDLLCSALAALLLQGRGEQPAYFSSPWMTDFPLLGNEFRQFADLFVEESGPVVRLSAYLKALSRHRPVRVILVAHPPSLPFASHDVFRRHPGPEIRFAPETYHEKGILAPTFYFEGSMNLTNAGVYVREEKVVYHAGDDAASKFAAAYLEYGRFWEQLDGR